jgi:hypothetical protein
LCRYIKAGRGLLPGGDAPGVSFIDADSTHVSLAVRAAEPSAGVGFPLTVGLGLYSC